MRLIALLTCLSASLALAACDRQKAGEPQEKSPGAAAEQAGSDSYPAGRIDRSQSGRAAPTAMFEDGMGRPTSLAAFRGRPVLVNLWATWCAPCVVEMPSLDALAAREGDELQVVALSQDLDGRAKVTDFFRERGFRHLEAFLDPNMAFMTATGVGSLPTTILYDAEGREAWRITGIEDWQGERAAALIAQADAG